jgi:hypothetical protein
MAADDFLESEVAIAAAAAALFSPRVRKMASKGAVYGTAGLLTVGRAVAGVARDAARRTSNSASSGSGSRTASASS